MVKWAALILLASNTEKKEMLCQYCPTSGFILPYGPTEDLNLHLEQGVYTHLTLCQLNSMVKAQAHLLSCTKHVREYGIREGDWDYHQDFLPQELLWRHKNSEKEPDIKPDATNSHGLDFSPPLQISHKTKQKQCGSQEKVYRSKMHFC